MSDDPQGSPPVRQTDDGATKVPPEIGATGNGGFLGTSPILEGEVMAPRSKAGRPSLYDPELADEICTRIVNGTPLSMICEEEGMPCANTIYNWKQAHPEFGEKFQETRRRQLDMMRDKADVIQFRLLKGTIEPSAAVVALRHIEWNLARLRPDLFGEHVGVGIGAPGQGVALPADKGQDAIAKMDQPHPRTTDRQVIAWKNRGNGARA